MNSQLLIISISLYIISIIGALILAIAGKKFSPWFLKIFAFAHVSFAATLAALTLLLGPNILSPYMYLLFLCSGLIFSGIMIRKLNRIFFKIYFSLFLFTIVVFVASPTRFFKTLYTGKPENLKTTAIALGENYYLTRQELFNESNELINYKIYRKKGIISETVATGITSEDEIESVEVITLKPGDTLVFKTITSTAVSNNVGVSLKSNKGRTKITRQ